MAVVVSILALITFSVVTVATPITSTSTTSRSDNIFTYAEAYHRALVESNDTLAFIADYVNSTGLSWNQEFQPIPFPGGRLVVSGTTSRKALSSRASGGVDEWLVRGYSQPNCKGSVTAEWDAWTHGLPVECMPVLLAGGMKSVEPYLAAINFNSKFTYYWNFYRNNLNCYEGLAWQSYPKMWDTVENEGCQTAEERNIWSWKVTRLRVGRPSVQIGGSGSGLKEARPAKAVATEESGEDSIEPVSTSTGTNVL